MKPESKKKKILFIVLSIMAVLIVAGGWALSAMVYNENFNQRFESYEPLMFYVDDFDQLQHTKYEFSSNKGQKLAGYMYSPGKGHNYFNDETYHNEFNAKFDEWLKTLDYDYDTAENKEQFSDDKANYIYQNLDRAKWCNSLDLELFEDFVDFYDEHIY